MSRTIIVIISLLFAFNCFGKDAKYVFYFIGDGMGANLVNYTEFYLDATTGDHSHNHLTFSKFPVHNQMTTYCANGTYTDSAAAGTALATGHKTNKGTIGLDAEGKKIESIAVTMKKAGRKVGIVSTKSINDATPAAFYGHRESRKELDGLVKDMVSAGFDFYAGNNIGKSKKRSANKGLDRKKEIGDAGYSVVRTSEEYEQTKDKASKIVFYPKNSIVEAIDRRKGDRENVSLKDMVRDAIDFLSLKDTENKGFFIMAEGGKIDTGCHGNDVASATLEVLDMDEAIKLAIEFYRQHPDETAILVTADHETGGIGITAREISQFTLIQHQKGSITTFNNALGDILSKNGNYIDWNATKALISEHTGLWSKIPVKKEDEAFLRKIYDNSIGLKQSGDITDEFGYHHNAAIVFESIRLLNRYAGAEWIGTSHTCGYVPLYYIGPQAGLFSCDMDNTLVAPKLLQAAGL